MKKPVFASLPAIFSWIKQNLSQAQYVFSFNAIRVFKKSKWPVSVTSCTCTCSEIVAHLNAILWVVTEQALLLGSLEVF